MAKLARNQDAVFGDVITHSSPEADLIVFEDGHNISFPLKRTFAILAKDKTSRGKHAHRECAQAFFCAAGACEVSLEDGESKKTYLLDSPDKILYMPPGLWGEQNYLTEGTVLMVLCDTAYDEGDYIRDYDAFLKYREENA